MSPRKTSSQRKKSPLASLRRKPAGLAAAAAVVTAAMAAAGAALPASAATALPAAAGHVVSLPRTTAVVRAPLIGQPVSAAHVADAPGHRGAAGGHATAVRLAAANRTALPAAARTAGGTQDRGVPGHLSAHSPCGSSALHQWICSAESIMIRNGTPRSAVDTSAAYIVVMHESGGNPNAYNGWDSNAAAGTPSEGIAQTIAPTFSTYALPGHRDIWNPVDNMIAAFRYAISRYGSMSNIPGVVAVQQGGSYVGY